MSLTRINYECTYDAEVYYTTVIYARTCGSFVNGEVVKVDLARERRYKGRRKEKVSYLPRI